MSTNWKLKFQRNINALAEIATTLPVLHARSLMRVERFLRELEGKVRVWRAIAAAVDTWANTPLEGDHTKEYKSGYADAQKHLRGRIYAATVDPAKKTKSVKEVAGALRAVADRELGDGA